jgi:hypothetical protein
MAAWCSHATCQYVPFTDLAVITALPPVLNLGGGHSHAVCLFNHGDVLFCGTDNQLAFSITTWHE